MNRPDSIVMDTRACLLVCAFGVVAQLIEAYDGAYLRHLSAGVRVRTGAADLLESLQGEVAIGVITSLGQSALPDEVRSLANSAGAWSLAAFLLCLANRNPRLGLVLGPVALAAMLLGYDVATESWLYGTFWSV